MREPRPAIKPALQSQTGLTERIVAACSRERPADQVLREHLKADRSLMPSDAQAISQTVFNYFRWRGWLDASLPLNRQIRQARELAQKFAAAPESFDDADLVARVAPEWLRAEMEISPAWARAIQAEPKLWLRAQPGQGGALAQRLGAAKLSKEMPDAVHYKGEEDLFQREEFHAGEFEIQDIASQAVGWVCAPQPGETWWDTCAGEGGKTLHLSALMQNKGLIWASDRAEWRLKSLKRRAARAKVFNFRAVPWNWDAKPPTKTKFDGILVDAPCSGVGTWQRNPHARWTTDLQDVQELAAIQKRLLAHAAPSVKPGGKLFYAVCTLTRSETTDVVADFNAKLGAEFEPLVQENLDATKFIWPDDLDGNGMFIAGWRRKK
ncbi:MAG: RsmB/NOP family class I SAM-dependent RNA methyltransferase [Verrucomicrobia bacterium]|nr:RsmB/NOP family class I SAM-dependent RNA methyltransferase [Verrucomicrobiota bacterium]